MIWVYYILSAVVVVLDQLTKWIAVEYLMPVESVPLIDGVFHFTYVENTGAAFGIMKDSKWVFMITSAVAIVALVFMLAKFARQYRFASFAIAIILGGGIGNMIDRVRFGYVVDFIDVRIINFAVFNVADSFVTVGAALLILYLVRELILESKRASQQVTEEGDDASAISDDGVITKNSDTGSGDTVGEAAGEAAGDTDDAPRDTKDAEIPDDKR